MEETPPSPQGEGKGEAFEWGEGVVEATLEEVREMVLGGELKMKYLVFALVFVIVGLICTDVLLCNYIEKFDSLFAYQYFDGRESGGDLKWHDINNKYRGNIRNHLMRSGVTHLVILDCHKFSPMQFCEVRVVPNDH